MNSLLFPASLLHSTTTTTVIFIFIFIAIIKRCYCVDDEQYTECKQRNYSCGSIQNVGYPFCGHDRPQFCGAPEFELQCTDKNYTLIDIDSQEFRVLSIDQFVMRIARMDLWNNTCPEEFGSTRTTLNFSLFEFVSPSYKHVEIFSGCAAAEAAGLIMPDYPNFTCAIDGGKSDIGFYVEESSPQAQLLNQLLNQNLCSSHIIVPVLQRVFDDLVAGRETLQEGLKKGFEVEYNKIDGGACRECMDSGGSCGSNSTSPFNCYCSDRSHSRSCRSGNGVNWRWKIGIAFGALAAGIILTCAACFFYQRRNKKRYASSYLSRNISSEPSSSMTDVENMGRYFGVNIFTYNELEEATNNFDSSKELGDGGFGTVYYGKLRDGRVVAVKRLYENNYKRVEQFMNEVEILTRLRHQNLVALYGCTSRHSRELLLVYEYIPNGTVADHLHGERAKPGSVPWSIRMKIAIETACALTYLHASDIIHRDVKTNNILLDNNFCVKVADFGLSRLFPIDVTHISTAPQGTPGYVDPEYHQCYQLTDKSDVYSFGVVLMELISSMPAVDISRHRHEINLSNMAINKILNHALHELVDPYLGFESDNKVRKMISAVAELAFQCLQNEKEMRPSMEEVLEVLKDIQSKVYNNEGKAEEVLDIPGDNAVLLKSCPLPYSPNSVTATWISTSTASNASG